MRRQGLAGTQLGTAILGVEQLSHNKYRAEVSPVTKTTSQFGYLLWFPKQADLNSQFEQNI